MSQRLKDQHKNINHKLKVLNYIEEQKGCKRKIKNILENLGVSRSTYYHWKKEVHYQGVKVKRSNPYELLPQEEKMILDTHSRFPHLRHRQLQGMIQHAGHYISPSSVLKVLQKHDLVEDYQRRPSPLKKPSYEAWRRNLLWCEDWTKILINWKKWHFLAVIDAFSRKIISWDIVPQVSSSDIKKIYQEGLRKEGLITGKYPKLRADRGSPNTSQYTKQFFKEIGANLSFAGVRRPTENARIERFFGTFKQEEFYLCKNYPDLATAKRSIEDYIEFYNKERPHQGLWNFTPAHCHSLNNKTLLLKELSSLKEKSKELRLELRGSINDRDFKIKNFEILKDLKNNCSQQTL